MPFYGGEMSISRDLIPEPASITQLRIGRESGFPKVRYGKQSASQLTFLPFPAPFGR